jgi:hypothetical protein
MSRGACFVAAVVSVVGCADEDGMIVEFVVAPGIAADEIDALDIWIGMPDPQMPGTFIRDPADSDMRTGVTFPYRVLFRAGERPTPVLIGGVGYAGDANQMRIAEGSLDAPVELVPGELVFGGQVVLRRDVPACFAGDTVTLGDTDMDGSVNCNDCEPMNSNNGPGLEEQCDGFDNNCDGKADTDVDGDLITYHFDAAMPEDGFWADTCSHARADCDDDDPDRYPNALETCNGESDSCGRRGSIGKRPCFYLDGTSECVIGERMCDDSAGLWSPGCAPGGPTAFAVPESMCSLWSLFEGSPWPELAIANSTMTDARWCEVAVTRSTSLPCALPDLRFDPGVVPQGPTGAVCRATLVGGRVHDGYTLSLGLRMNPGAPLDVRQDSCEVDVVVEQVDGEGDPTVKLPKVAVLLLYEYDLELDPTILAMPVALVLEPRFIDGACPLAPVCQPLP